MKKSIQNLIKKYPKLTYLSNKYVIITILFIFWMLFLDNYSYLDHRILNSEMSELKNSKSYYLNEIKKDQKQIDELRETDKLEGYAREKYFMKRPNEDIYIIEFEEDLN
nr:septum formation initiator family protein [uncultured Flavobacterium sp.]